MAEPVSILLAVPSIVAEGVKLSKTLYVFAHEIRNAPKEARAFAEELDMTATLLAAFEKSLRTPDIRKLANAHWHERTQKCLEFSQATFKDLQTELTKAIPGIDFRAEDTETPARFARDFVIRKRDQVKWPFARTSIAELFVRLGKIKADLNFADSLIVKAHLLHESQKAASRRKQENLAADRRLKLERDLIKHELKGLELRSQFADDAFQNLDSASVDTTLINSLANGHQTLHGNFPSWMLDENQRQDCKLMSSNDRASENTPTPNIAILQTQGVTENINESIGIAPASEPGTHSANEQSANPSQSVPPTLNNADDAGIHNSRHPKNLDHDDYETSTASKHLSSTTPTAFRVNGQVPAMNSQNTEPAAGATLVAEPSTTQLSLSAPARTLFPASAASSTGPRPAHDQSVGPLEVMQARSRSSQEPATRQTEPVATRSLGVPELPQKSEAQKSDGHSAPRSLRNFLKLTRSHRDSQSTRDKIHSTFNDPCHQFEVWQWTRSILSEFWENENVIVPRADIVNGVVDFQKKQKSLSKQYARLEIDLQHAIRMNLQAKNQDLLDSWTVVAMQIIPKRARLQDVDIVRVTFCLRGHSSGSQEGDPAIALRPTRLPPILLRDAVGRKYSLPWQLADTWKGVHELICQAVVHMKELEGRVQQAQFDLIGPNDEIILPCTWTSIVRPGWTVKMVLWPMTSDQEPSKVEQAVVNADPSGPALSALPAASQTVAAPEAQRQLPSETTRLQLPSQNVPNPWVYPVGVPHVQPPPLLKWMAGGGVKRRQERLDQDERATVFSTGQTLYDHDARLQPNLKSKPGKQQEENNVKSNVARGPLGQERLETPKMKQRSKESRLRKERMAAAAAHGPHASKETPKDQTKPQLRRDVRKEREVIREISEGDGNRSGATKEQPAHEQEMIDEGESESDPLVDILQRYTRIHLHDDADESDKDGAGTTD